MFLLCSSLCSGAAAKVKANLRRQHQPARPTAHQTTLAQSPASAAKRASAARLREQGCDAPRGNVRKKRGKEGSCRGDSSTGEGPPRAVRRGVRHDKVFGYHERHPAALRALGGEQDALQRGGGRGGAVDGGHHGEHPCVDGRWRKRCQGPAGSCMAREDDAESFGKQSQ